MSDEQATPTSVIYDHCMKVYKEMESQAREENLTDGTGPTKEVVKGLVYEGHLTKLIASLDFPAPYYTRLMRLLKELNCMEQLRRGGGNSPSRWLLIRPPTEEAFNELQALKRPTVGKVADLEQRMRDINSRLSNVEQLVQALLESREAA